MAIYYLEYKPVLCPFCNGKLVKGAYSFVYCNNCTQGFIGQNDNKLKGMIRWLLK